MINDLLSKGDRHIVENLEKLFNEEIIYKAVRDYTEYKFDSSDIWELFLYSGYLTIAGEKQGEEYPLRLPNKEIQSFFRKIFIEKFIGNYDKFLHIIRNLKDGKIEEFAEGLEEEILSSLSYFDTGRDEKYYKIFLIGIFIHFQMITSDFQKEKQVPEGQTLFWNLKIKKIQHTYLNLKLLRMKRNLKIMLLKVFIR